MTFIKYCSQQAECRLLIPTVLHDVLLEAGKIGRLTVELLCKPLPAIHGVLSKSIGAAVTGGPTRTVRRYDASRQIRRWKLARKLRLRLRRKRKNTLAEPRNNGRARTRKYYKDRPVLIGNAERLY